MGRVLGEQGINRDDARGRLEFSRRMEDRRPLENELTDADRAIRRAWRFGSEEFVERMVEHSEKDFGENQTWPERAERMELRAERLIAEGLREAGWRRPRLAKEAKGHPVKVALAIVPAALPTTVSVEFSGVSEFRFQPGDSALQLTEDDCSRTFGFWIDEDRANGVIQYEPSQTPKAERLTPIEFMSGAVVAVQADSVSQHLRRERAVKNCWLIPVLSR